MVTFCWSVLVSLWTFTLTLVCVCVSLSGNSSLFFNSVGAKWKQIETEVFYHSSPPTKMLKWCWFAKYFPSSNPMSLFFWSRSKWQWIFSTIHWMNLKIMSVGWKTFSSSLIRYSVLISKNGTLLESCS